MAGTICEAVEERILPKPGEIYKLIEHHQVSPVDPITLSWTVLVLLVTACAAAAIPASRAARVDPMTVLREE
jgi:ABC-type lipoprotein release transport system permease subunit